jgi:hypothetical protein
VENDRWWLDFTLTQASLHFLLCVALCRLDLDCVLQGESESWWWCWWFVVVAMHPYRGGLGGADTLYSYSHRRSPLQHRYSSEGMEKVCVCMRRSEACPLLTLFLCMCPSLWMDPVSGGRRVPIDRSLRGAAVPIKRSLSALA